MGAKITLMGPEWISLDGSLPKVQEPCYFLDREKVFRGVMDESGDVYEILDNDTNDIVYHSNIEDGYIVFWKVIIYQFTPPYKKIDKSHFY